MAGGKVLQSIGARKEARAAQNAADAQADEAKRARTEQVGEARHWADQSISAAMSTSELAAYDQSLGYAQKQAETDQRLIDSIDPSIMEASKQILGLLRGDQSSVGKNMEAQRGQQREKLVNQLREQLGPGAENSSMGRQALLHFDSETANVLNGSQQQSLAGLMGLVGQGNSITNRGIQSISNIGQLYGAQAQRMSAAQQNAGASVLNAMTGANQAVLQTAGSEYLGSQLMGRNQQQLGREWSQDSAQFMGIMGSAFTGSSGGGGKGAPAQNTSPTVGSGGTGPVSGYNYNQSPSSFWGVG